MPNTNMATWGTRMFSVFRGGLWIKPNIHKSETGAPSANNNQGARDMVRLTLQRSPNQASDMAQIVDENGNLLAGFDFSGNGYQSGVPGVKYCVTQVTLTAAQLAALYVTPLTIVPAPAAGQAICVDSITFELNLGATAFTAGGVVHFYYHGKAVEVMAQTIAAATVNGATGQSIYLLEPVQTAGGSVVSPGLGLDITNATQAFANGGTSTITVSVFYNLVTLV